MRLFLALLSLALVGAGAASGQQATFPLRLLVTQGGSAITVQNNGTLVFNGVPGETVTARLTATNIGAGTITITQAPTVFGSVAFRATLTQPLPISLSPNVSFSVDLEFTPSDSVPFTELSLPFTETLPPTPGSGQATVTPNAINLVLRGTSPSIVYSYVFQSDQNNVQIQPRGIVEFPPTRVGATGQATFKISNIGNGLGRITGVSVNGDAFRLLGLPLFPVTLGGSEVLQLGLFYEPTRVGSDSGQLTVTLEGGVTATFGLHGDAISPNFVYEVLDADPPSAVPPGGTIVLPPANLTRTTSSVIRIRNAGNTAGTVDSITIVGQGFQLVNPVVLPRTLAPDGSLAFTINFTPTQPETSTGFLFINGNLFNLKGVGLGSRLEFTYFVAGSMVTIGPANPSVVFGPVTVSQSSEIRVGVRNTGTSTAVISNIGVGQVSGPFELSAAPALPFSLPPDQEVPISITFKPVALGFANGTLILDNLTIPLVGSGANPPPLPGYTITGPSGVSAALSQVPVGLSLAQPYPVAISGMLALNASSELPSDPALQFSTGGRSVAFTIPANATEAVFGSQGTRIGLQTGTVASSMTLTPSFATQAGNVNLTPSNPTVLPFSVSAGAPTLLRAQILNQTSNAFVLTVTGFSTTRSLTNMQVQFEPAPGINISGNQFTINIQLAAATWFRNNGSLAFGGQFTISLPFTFQGTLANGATALSGIASISVSVSNETGGSNTLQVAVQ